MNAEEYRAYEGAFVKMINGGFFDIYGYKLICVSASITSVKPYTDQNYKVDMSVAYRFAAIPGQNPRTNLSSE